MESKLQQANLLVIIDDEINQAIRVILFEVLIPEISGVAVLKR